MGCRQPPFLTRRFGIAQCRLDTNAAYWSSWADSFQMIHSRHPSVEGKILHELSHRNTSGFHVAAAGAATGGVDALRVSRLRRGESVTAGRGPAVPDVEDRQICMPLFGWQQAAIGAVHTHVVESTVRPPLNPTEQAMLRSKWCPLFGGTVPVLPFQRGVSVRLFPIPHFAFPPSLASLSSPLHAVVGVAVPLTSLATTGQLVQKQGCWVAEGMHWSRQPRGFAARQGPGWAPTSWSTTWICCHRTICGRMGQLW